MSYILNSVTLPRPYGLERRPVEVAKTNTTLDGSSRKDIIKQKEIFILDYRNLTQSQVADIVAIYEGKSAVSFSVSDESLTISSVTVLVTMDARQYNSKGSEYREDFKLILEEV